MSLLESDVANGTYSRRGREEVCRAACDGHVSQCGLYTKRLLKDFKASFPRRG